MPKKFLARQIRIRVESQNAKVLGIVLSAPTLLRPDGDRIKILFGAVHESAIGPKRTSAPALHMSAFGGKADKLCGPLTLGATSIWSRAFGVARCVVILKVV